MLTAAILSAEAYRRWQGRGPAHAGEARLVLQDLHDLTSRIQGLTSHLLGIGAEYARLERLQADLSHAARVAILGELAASMAHEVNQPLTAIVTAAQASIRWMERPEPGIEEVRVLSQQIVEEAERSSQIIGRIRHMAMRRAPVFGSVCLNSLIEEALLMIRHEAELNAVKVVANLEPGLPALVGDKIQLQQVIVNLALNAVQALAPSQDHGGCLTVRTRGGGDRLTVTVSDTGPGIGPEEAEHIFTSFFTTKEQGVGIGLAICRSIVEAHGGFIRALDNEGGAVFEFELPVGEPRSAALARP